MGGMQVEEIRGLGRLEKISVQTLPSLFLTKGALTTEAGSLFWYFTTLAELSPPAIALTLECR